MVASATSITSEMLALGQSEKKKAGPTLAEILSAHTEVEEAKKEVVEDDAVFASRKGTYDCVADVMFRMRQLMEVVSGGGYTLTLSSSATSSSAASSATSFSAGGGVASCWISNSVASLGASTEVVEEHPSDNAVEQNTMAMEYCVGISLVSRALLLAG